MKSMLVAFAVIVLIAVGADIALDLLGFSTQAITSGPAVRHG